MGCSLFYLCLCATGSVLVERYKERLETSPLLLLSGLRRLPATNQRLIVYPLEDVKSDPSFIRPVYQSLSCSSTSLPSTSSLRPRKTDSTNNMAFVLPMLRIILHKFSPNERSERSRNSEASGPSASRRRGREAASPKSHASVDLTLGISGTSSQFSPASPSGRRLKRSLTRCYVNIFF